MKQSFLAALFISTLFVITGCGGGGGGGGSVPGYDTEKTEIAQALSGFKTAVEAYDVNGMLAVFDDSDPTAMVLTIIGGNFTDKKSYSTLKRELKEDEIDQLTWRKKPTEGGHGYKLDMELGPLGYSNMSATGGYATQTFEIYESSEVPPIARTKTDSGTIFWSVAKITGKWRVVSMTITYNSITTQVKSLTKSMSGFTATGFRFGKGYSNL